MFADHEACSNRLLYALVVFSSSSAVPANRQHSRAPNAWQPDSEPSNVLRRLSIFCYVRSKEDINYCS